jgi:hypothetical protein
MSANVKLTLVTVSAVFEPEIPCNLSSALYITMILVSKLYSIKWMDYN